MDKNLQKNLQARNVLRVALYIRVSTQEQAKEGYSIGEQEARLRDYCKAMKWDIYKIYVDPGYSGGDTARPGLQDMIRDVKAGVIDKIIVYKLDRLSRSQKDTLVLIEDVFIANNVEFGSMTENFDTSSPFGRAMLGMLAVFAQLEKDKINERMTMGKEARAKLGLWNGGTEPIGYDYSKNDDMLYPNEYEQIQLRELRELFLKGTPLRTIETIFDEKGYKHKHGKWDPKAMRRVLRSKLYLGYLNYKGEWYKGTHIATLDSDTHEKLLAILDQRKESYEALGIKPGAQTTYLGGILYCKQCGGKYCKNAWKQRNGENKLFYSCYSRSKKSKKMIKDPNCKNKHWHMEELDGIVFNEIRKLTLDRDYLLSLFNNEPAETEEPNKIDILKAEIRKLDDQISRFMDLYGIGKFTIDQVSSKVDPLNEQKNALLRELDSIRGESGALSEEEAIEIIDTFDEVFERGDFNETRLLIESLIYYIELDNDDVYIHWKFA